MPGQMINRKVIWKFELEPITALHVPADFKVLTVQAQREIPCIWIELDPDAAFSEQILIKACQTGDDMDADTGEYVGTFQLNDGYIVRHAYLYRDQG